MIRAAVSFLLLSLAPHVALAVELSLLDGAHRLSHRVSPMDSYNLPIGPFTDTNVPTRLMEGQLDRQTWRLDGSALTTLQLITPLREQIQAVGFDLLFECRDKTCGGFDFRFDIEVAPAPGMFVDVRNYRFLSAVKGNNEAISLLVSTNRNAAYLQVIQVGSVDRDAIEIAPDQAKTGPRPKQEPAPVNLGLIENLKRQGHVVLDDLVFNSGAARLDNGPFASLSALAEYLADNPKQHVAVVGHTDSTGGLDPNIALSKNRATAVRDRLIDTYKTDPEQVQAQGMGYLAPVASNLTAEGRDANRRVEVILLSQ
jgi:OmpA-OmpF porin, OOP family